MNVTGTSAGHASRVVRATRGGGVRGKAPDAYAGRGPLSSLASTFVRATGGCGGRGKAPDAFAGRGPRPLLL